MESKDRERDHKENRSKKSGLTVTHRTKGNKIEDEPEFKKLVRLIETKKINSDRLKQYLEEKNDGNEG